MWKLIHIIEWGEGKIKESVMGSLWEGDGFTVDECGPWETINGILWTKESQSK